MKVHGDQEPELFEDTLDPMTEKNRLLWFRENVEKTPEGFRYDEYVITVPSDYQSIEADLAFWKQAAIDREREPEAPLDEAVMNAVTELEEHADAITELGNVTEESSEEAADALTELAGMIAELESRITAMEGGI